jgi:hypothetical protein
VKYTILHLPGKEGVIIHYRVHAIQIHICIMTIPQDTRKKALSGRAIRLEPQELELINEDPNVREYFEQVGCVFYCEKIQGYNVKLVEQLTLRFNVFFVIIAGITFQVTEETLSAGIEIIPRGERWYKGMPLYVLCYEYFFKPNYQNGKIRASVLIWYFWEPF